MTKRFFCIGHSSEPSLDSPNSKNLRASIMRGIISLTGLDILMFLVSFPLLFLCVPVTFDLQRPCVNPMEMPTPKLQWPWTCKLGMRHSPGSGCMWQLVGAAGGLSALSPFWRGLLCMGLVWLVTWHFYFGFVYHVEFGNLSMPTFSIFLYIVQILRLTNMPIEWMEQEKLSNQEKKCNKSILSSILQSVPVLNQLAYLCPYHCVTQYMFFICASVTLSLYV